MSRIANNPVNIPSAVELTLAGQNVGLKGPKGAFAYEIHRDVEVKHEGETLKFLARNNSKNANALAGTMRSIVNNMVYGVERGFEKKLKLVGIGYRAQLKGKVLNLTLGFSHPVDFDIPEGINIETPSQTEIIVKGIDKQKVGQVSADIRSFRPPEPYKGKGVRYEDETIVLKEAKKK